MSDILKRQPPPYFAPIELNASNRWKQLEADPELAGPWHQLFSQVQSPPHVLSELLQNADDAGATKAVAKIVNGEFIFEHNGDDFTSDQFASLCRFAFSNKRTLHTIGFRGVGFKSTFSLGDDVEVLTPTLAVRYSRARFTLPIWLESSPPAASTVVRVRVADKHRLQELEESLLQWATSPVSLLFFRNLLELEINGRQIAKKRIGNGPVPNSEIVSLTHLDSASRQKTENLLVAHSEAEPFPEDAVREIRKERNISDMQFHHAASSWFSALAATSASTWCCRQGLFWTCPFPSMLRSFKILPDTASRNRQPHRRTVGFCNGQAFWRQRY